MKRRSTSLFLATCGVSLPAAVASAQLAPVVPHQVTLVTSPGDDFGYSLLNTGTSYGGNPTFDIAIGSPGDQGAPPPGVPGIITSGLVALADQLLNADGVPVPGGFLPYAALLGPAGVHAGSRFGESLAGARDLDGDGVNDLLIGDPGLSVVYALSGAQLANIAPFLLVPEPVWSAAVIWKVTGPGGTLAPGGGFGRSISILGAGPGETPIVAIGNPFALSGATTRGTVYFFDGATGAPVFQPVSDPSGASSWFGAALGTQAQFDLNGDGLDDLVVGDPLNDVVSWVEPASGSVLGQAFGPDGSEYGSALAIMNDVTGDGTPETVIGAPGIGMMGGLPGQVEVYDSQATTWIETIFPSGAAAAGDRFGHALRVFTTAGIPDALVIGAPGAQIGSGMIEVLLMPASGSTPLATSVPVPAPYKGSGWAIEDVRNASIIGGTGLGIMVGAPYSAPGIACNASPVIYCGGSVAVY